MNNNNNVTMCVCAFVKKKLFSKVRGIFLFFTENRRTSSCIYLQILFKINY